MLKNTAVRIAIIVVLVVILYYLVVTLGRSVANGAVLERGSSVAAAPAQAPASRLPALR